jgi:sec-independent protein translocase protein TatC
MTLLDEVAPAPGLADAKLPREGEKTATVYEHLAELRRRMLLGIAALVVGTVIAWFFYDQVVSFMAGPYRAFLHHHPHEDISGGNLVTTGPLEGFTTRLKVSGYLGAIIAAPVWLWQVWRFVTPGLYRSEKRYAAPFLLSAVALFALGAGTAVLVFPKAISWIIGVSGSGVVPLFSPGRYLGLYAMCCLIFGLAFTYPVVLVFLEVVRVLPSARLRKWRRYAIVVLVAVASVITPSSDPFSFLAMAVPLVVFYEASILVGRILKR